MLGLLTLVLLALEIKLRVYPEVWETPIYQLRIVQTALVSAIILAAQKINPDEKAGYMIWDHRGTRYFEVDYEKDKQ